MESLTSFSGAVIDLGTLGGTSSQAFGINDAGQVVGYAETASQGRAFLYTDTNGNGLSDPGEMVGFGTFGGHFSQAYDINETGQVVGYAQTPSGLTHAFLFTDKNGNGGNDPGEMVDLGTLGGTSSTLGGTLSEAYFSEAHGINNAGQVVGYAQTPSGLTHAFLYTDTNGNGSNDPGEMIDLGTLGGTLSEAQDINEAGRVVGYARTLSSIVHAFVYTDKDGDGTSDPGEMVDLGTLGGTSSYAYDINEAGQVVGLADTASGVPHAFLYTDTNGNGLSDPGEMVDLGTLGGTSSYAYGINEAGQVAGFSYTASGAIHAFIYTDANGDGTSDPGEMLDLGPGDAQAINSAGQVVGSTQTASGAAHATLWKGEDAQ
jgi:probable HAF family extracellular repeat protein